MDLVRWVVGLGLIPRVVGNIKGLQDPYRNPTTQQGFAEQWGQNPTMVTSFADGTKISFEQSIVANATGFHVRSRGMSRGQEYLGDIMTIGELYDIDELRERGGIVDYVVGTPHTKVYVLAEHPDPKATALSEAVQDGRRASLLVLHAVPLGAFRGSQLDCTSLVVPGRGRSPHRRAGRRSLRSRQERPQGRRGSRRLRHVHDLRRSGQRQRNVGRPLPARRAGGGLSPRQETSPWTRFSATTTSSSPKADWPTG